MQWKAVTRKISELKPQAQNPRTITKKQKEQLAKSIETFGIAEPICITKEGLILGGHQRYKILKIQNPKSREIPCWECQDDLNTAEIAELTIRLNKNRGDWDYDLLANSFDITDLLDWGFDLSELELEGDPETQEQPKSFQIIVTLMCQQSLENAEDYINNYLNEHKNGNYKIRIK